MSSAIARKYLVFTFIAAIAVSTLACVQYPLLDATLPITAESAHFVYHWGTNDGEDASACPIDTNRQERYFTWLCEALAIDPPSFRIHYYKYRDREEIARVTGRVGNAFAESDKERFHTIWQYDNHECVHVIADTFFGVPPLLFNEGLAVAHQATEIEGVFIPRWNGDDFHALCANALREGTLLSLDDVITSEAFATFPATTTYPLAGSFTRYLIDTYGIAKMKTYCAVSRFKDNGEATARKIESAYGTPLTTLWDAWHTFLRSYGYF